MIYTLSYGKFHGSGYADILYGINSIDIMGAVLQNTHGTQSDGKYLVLLPRLDEKS